MKKLLIFVSIVSIFLFSCQKEDEFLSPDINLDDIKISMSYAGQAEGNTASNLKSGSIEVPKISRGGEFEIYDMKHINIIFSAEDASGLAVNGTWFISINDPDISYPEGYYYQDTPNESVVGSIASIKPSVLGKYYCQFTPEGSLETYSFTFIHLGVAGDIGDGEENDYSFRIEKKNLYNGSKNKLEVAYTLYLKYDGTEFAAWESANQNDPNRIFPGDPDYFQVLLNSKSGGHTLKLYECKYSDYLYFTFMPSEYPAMSWGEYSYVIDFFSGVYGQNWWSFNAVRKSGWRTGPHSLSLGFKMF